MTNDKSKMTNNDPGSAVSGQFLLTTVPWNSTQFETKFGKASLINKISLLGKGGWVDDSICIFCE